MGHAQKLSFRLIHKTFACCKRGPFCLRDENDFLSDYREELFCLKVSLKGVYYWQIL